MTGVLSTRRLKKRVNMLLETKRMLLRFKTEISYASEDIGAIIRSSAEYTVCEAAAALPSFLFNPCHALLEAAKDKLPDAKDIEWFEDFISGLGQSDTAGQVEHIDLHKELLQTHIDQAVHDYSTKAKLYLALGLFSGVVLCTLIA